MEVIVRERSCRKGVESDKAVVWIVASAKKLCNSCHACKKLFSSSIFSLCMEWLCRRRGCNASAYWLGLPRSVPSQSRYSLCLCITCCCLAVGLRLYTQSLSTTQLIHERTSHEAGKVACGYRNRNPCPSKASMRFSLPYAADWPAGAWMRRTWLGHTKNEIEFVGFPRKYKGGFISQG